MLLALALLAVALLVAIVVLAVVLWPARRLAVRRRVVVNLLSGRAFDGVLWARSGRLLVLRGARMLEPGEAPRPLDGDVVLERDQVEFVQVA